MELTINHLKGYFGTGLKILDRTTKTTFSLDKFYNHEIPLEFQNKYGKIGLEQVIHDKQLLPCLYPLSTLTDYREDLGFVPIENLGHTMKFADDYLQFTDNSRDFYDLHWMPHKCIELFQQWHIDYQNLISNNLAIDTRTLTKPLI